MPAGVCRPIPIDVILSAASGVKKWAPSSPAAQAGMAHWGELYRELQHTLAAWMHLASPPDACISLHPPTPRAPGSVSTTAVPHHWAVRPHTQLWPFIRSLRFCSLLVAATAAAVPCSHAMCSMYLRSISVFVYVDATSASGESRCCVGRSQSRSTCPLSCHSLGL